MERIHGFEFGDQTWCPALIGDAITEYLRVIERAMGSHTFVLPVVEEALEASGADRIVDLCSGGAGTSAELRSLFAERGRDLELVLTDLKPNLDAFDGAEAQGKGRVRVIRESIDASKVPADLVGLRTIFNAFHHFQPELGRQVLTDAMKAQQSIVVIEVTERTLANALGVWLIPWFVAFTMPFMRPVRPAWLLLTYVIPIIPLVIAWDGVVSHLRTYSVSELQCLGDALDDYGYTWKIGRTQRGKMPAHFTWLVGTPTHAEEAELDPGE